MIQFEPIYLPVKSFRDSVELQKAVEILHNHKIMTVVERHTAESYSDIFRIAVQPLFWAEAKELLAQFDAKSTYLIKKDVTLLWTTMLMILIMMIFLILFPYEREPLNISILFVLSLIPGLLIGQNRIQYHCAVCGAENHHNTVHCKHCSRLIKGVVANAREIHDL